MTINNILTDHALGFVFSHLNPADFSSFCCVCPRWQVLGKEPSLWNRLDLNALFPRLTVIDENSWKTCIRCDALSLVFDDIPPLDKRAVILALNRLFASGLIDKENGATLLTMPKGFSFSTIVDFSEYIEEYLADEHLKKLSIHNYPCLINRLPALVSNGSKTFANSLNNSIGTVEEPYRVVISNSILIESKGKPFSYQRLMKQLPGFIAIGTLEAIALNMMTFITSYRKVEHRFGERIFTNCRESLNDVPVCVGSINVNLQNHVLPAIHILTLYTNFQNIGIAAVKKV